MRLVSLVILVIFSRCSSTHLVQKEISKKIAPVSPHYFTYDLDSLVQKLDDCSTREREEILVPMMLQGAIPGFNFIFRSVRITARSSNGKRYKAILFVSPDYICFGSDKQYMRLPLSPQAAQLLADSFHCVLPTTKMVDAIYAKANLKIAPIPITEKREAMSTFLLHHKTIQQQGGSNTPATLTAGTKKDIVQTPLLSSTAKQNRVAIYGWHKLNGIPIQPLYLGHVDWYVDYSHGARLVYEKMILNGKIVSIQEMLNDKQLQHILCRESDCEYIRYPHYQ